MIFWSIRIRLDQPCDSTPVRTITQKAGYKRVTYPALSLVALSLSNNPRWTPSVIMV